jgi:DNA-binding response OmpR family regulator
MKIKIALVDDERDLLKVVSDTLNLNGFEVESFSDGKSFLDKFKNKNFRENIDIILLDVMMPKMNGESVLAEINRLNKSKKPQVIIYTNKTSWESNVSFKNSGADDYVDKSAPREVLISTINARVRSVSQDNVNDKTIDQIKFGNAKLAIDKSLRKIFFDEKSVKLTKNEYELLEFLIMSKGRVITKEELACNVLGYGNQAKTRTIDVHVSNIRKKFYELNPIFEGCLYTKWGEGIVCNLL